MGGVGLSAPAGKVKLRWGGKATGLQKVAEGQKQNMRLEAEVGLDEQGLGVDKRVVFQKGGFGGCSPGTKTGTRVHSDVAPERKSERGYVRMFPQNENRNEGTFAKTTLYETALLSPSESQHS